MGDLTANFSRYEFRCRHCGDYRRPPAAFLANLQALRDLVGKPLVLVSSYRCPTGNRRVGGIPTSQHLTANAADIRGDYATIAQCRIVGFGMIGVRNGRVVHVDQTPGRSGVVFDD